MAEVASVDYYCGDVATIIATNRPFTDMTVQSQVNDYRWADSANIKIYNEKNERVADAEMCPITGKVGWYYYRYQTTCDCGTGVHRVEITMTTAVEDCSSPPTTGASGDPGTSGTSGTSGDPGGLIDCTNVAVYYLRVNPRR
jgi:hypothetical protein